MHHIGIDAMTLTEVRDAAAAEGRSTADFYRRHSDFSARVMTSAGSSSSTEAIRRSAELLAVDSTLWGGYISGVRVDGSNVRDTAGVGR
ncbi:hypothetical protein BKA24_001154 [Microbacterium marinum]|uniref:Uncharacterized protein n=1 Tax=Microbacterium marinum TaxID=421115 RepID=A0A7W7BPJ5_9MICO|nr:hypothetical protein [Microbacterium marinum]MBB4666445.1 hypothetical protein [Microbacterium marinum]